MLEDLFNPIAEIEINGKKYRAEYDFKSYAILETLTGKGFYKLYDLLMKDNNLTLSDSVEMVCCALVKHHSTEEVEQVRNYLRENLHAIHDINNKIIGVFVTPILAPEILETIDDFKKKMQEIEKTQTPKT